MDWKLTKETPCVVVTEDEGTSFKMVSFNPENKSFSLRSLNQLYSTYEVNTKEVRESLKFEAALSKKLSTETLTLQQIRLSIAEINRKLESMKSCPLCNMPDKPAYLPIE